MGRMREGVTLIRANSQSWGLEMEIFSSDNCDKSTASHKTTLPKGQFSRAIIWSDKRFQSPSSAWHQSERKAPTSYHHDVTQLA